MVISVGLVDPKPRPRGVTDGHQVNIPELQANRPLSYVDSLDGLYSRKGACLPGRIRTMKMRCDGAGRSERPH